VFATSRTSPIIVFVGVAEHTASSAQCWSSVNGANSGNHIATTRAAQRSRATRSFTVDYVEIGK
jgi:hypothetical protein